MPEDLSPYLQPGVTVQSTDDSVVAFTRRAIGSETDSIEQIRQLFTLRNETETGGQLAHQMIDILRGQQEAIDSKIQQYVELRERTTRGIAVLQDCQSCDIRVFERDCHNCEVYQRHEEVPDLVECAIFGQ